jgi:hypothetical protein
MSPIDIKTMLPISPIAEGEMAQTSVLKWYLFLGKLMIVISVFYCCQLPVSYPKEQNNWWSVDLREFLKKVAHLSHIYPNNVKFFLAKFIRECLNVCFSSYCYCRAKAKKTTISQCSQIHILFLKLIFHVWLFCIHEHFSLIHLISYYLFFSADNYCEFVFFFKYDDLF